MLKQLQNGRWRRWRKGIMYYDRFDELAVKMKEFFKCLFYPLQLLTFTNISRPWLMVSNQALLFSKINLKFKSLSMSLSQASSFQTNQAAGTLLIKLVQPGDLRSKKDPCCFSPFAMMISIWAARILALSAQCNSWNFNSLLINQGITFS